MTENGVVVTTKDNLANVLRNDEKSIIIRGKLAEDIQRKQRIQKFGLVSLFVFSISLFAIPCFRSFISPQTLSISTYTDNSENYIRTNNPPRNTQLLRTTTSSESTESPESNENKVSTIDQITEFTKKEIFSINLGLGLLVILSICCLLHKIVNKYEEILFKVEGKVEIHLIHK